MKLIRRPVLAPRLEEVFPDGKIDVIVGIPHSIFTLLSDADDMADYLSQLTVGSPILDFKGVYVYGVTAHYLWFRYFAYFPPEVRDYLLYCHG